MPATLLQETVIGLTSIQLALTGAVVSVLSLLVALRFAWLSKLSPPKLVGLFPYVVLYVLSNPRSQSNEYLLLPAVWLTNVGARPMLAAEMRLLINLSGAAKLTLLPAHTVPPEAIEAPYLSEYELLECAKAPFSGFSIGPGERWANNFVFPLSPEEGQLLQQPAMVAVEVRPIGKKRFKRVLEQQVDFAPSEFSWLDWVGIGGSSAQYFYANA